ncbi:unnamed protein product [Brassicogethes aeneus]|uniref:Uncharacterized protein n=1 Tax=Brassicogethes aeneus TaxID=1431903 RepID=A0A9P0FKQ7_BRAAE|nr:unnamed protein product [Brassicogethes aeneus]
MGTCTHRYQQIIAFTLAALLLGFGISMAILWNNSFINIRNKQLSVAHDTQGFKMWKETPIPMYMEFYLFNWTNANEFMDNKWPTKPNFQECGPYTYSEHHIREQLTFNENNTITYKTRKVWKFVPEKSKGKLDDKITTINTILAAVADKVKEKCFIVQGGLNIFIKLKSEPFILTRTAEEFLFKGYDDPFIKLANKLHIKGLDIPFDKFAWFYGRNNSVDYDGVLNMYSGVDDINKLGRLHSWNYKSQLDYYPGECGRVRGTSGELWYPPLDNEVLEVFSPDICGTIKIRKNGTILHNGIKGNKYLAAPEIFDYTEPQNQCYLPKGVHLAKLWC